MFKALELDVPEGYTTWLTRNYCDARTEVTSEIYDAIEDLRRKYDSLQKLVLALHSKQISEDEFISILTEGSK